MVTRSPGLAIPARSSSTSTSKLWGCAPPLRFSGDSCTCIFCESMNWDSWISNLNGPFLPQVSFSHSRGSTNLISVWGMIVMCSQRMHLKAALMILGRTSVALRIIPSTAMSCKRCLLRRSLPGMRFGILMKRTFALSMVFSMGISMLLSALSAHGSTSSG